MDQVVWFYVFSLGVFVALVIYWGYWELNHDKWTGKNETGDFFWGAIVMLVVAYVYGKFYDKFLYARPVSTQHYWLDPRTGYNAGTYVLGLFTVIGLFSAAAILVYAVKVFWETRYC